jgi:hypothetical protein
MRSWKRLGSDQRAQKARQVADLNPGAWFSANFPNFSARITAFTFAQNELHE